VSAEQPRAMELETISGQSGAALSALIVSQPQEVRDVSALEDLGKDPDPDAEVTANVGASISLSDLAVRITANVGVLISPPVLYVVAATNVGATTSLAQTTPFISPKSDVAVDVGIGREDLVPGIATEILSTPSYLQSIQTYTLQGTKKSSSSSLILHWRPTWGLPTLPVLVGSHSWQWEVRFHAHPEWD